MSKMHIVLALSGVALMSWGGASIASRLGLSGFGQADVALFALGIVFLAQAPYISLIARVRELEAGLKLPPTNTGVAAS